MGAEECRIRFDSRLHFLKCSIGALGESPRVAQVSGRKFGIVSLVDPAERLLLSQRDFQT
jgi:hypothetical protein